MESDGGDDESRSATPGGFLDLRCLTQVRDATSRSDVLAPAIAA